MSRKLLKESPSQTAGPYVHIGCTPNFAGIAGVYDTDPGAKMVDDETQGERIAVTGTIFDGVGVALTDALVEIWQADATGQYGSNLGFMGWGRCPADQTTGAWRFDTIKPGSVDGSARHITFWIVARGINLGLHTRMYFPGEPALEQDSWLARIDPSRRATLIAQQIAPAHYHFDIHLQGSNETVFFNA